MNDYIQVYDGNGRKESDDITLLCQTNGVHLYDENKGAKNAIKADLWFDMHGEDIARRLTKFMNERFWIPTLTVTMPNKLYHRTFPAVRLRNVVLRPGSDRCIFVRFTWNHDE